MIANGEFKLFEKQDGGVRWCGSVTGLQKLSAVFEELSRKTDNELYAVDVHSKEVLTWTNGKVVGMGMGSLTHEPSQKMNSKRLPMKWRWETNVAEAICSWRECAKIGLLTADRAWLCKEHVFEIVAFHGICSPPDGRQIDEARVQTEERRILESIVW